MPFSILPPDIAPWIGVFLLGISFIGSFITVALGIGGGVVVLAVVASLMPPAALLPVHGLVQLGSNGGRAILMWSHTDRAIMMSFVAGALVGVTIGGLIVVDLPAEIIQISVGAFVLWTIVAKPPAFMRHSAWLVGGISSVLTMFFGATGPFVAAYLKTLELDRMTHVANHAVCMTVQHGFKVVAFAVLGFAFGPYLVLIIGMIVAGFLGTIVGKRVLMRIDEKRFRIALNVMLVLLSLRLIWSGGYDLLQGSGT